MAERFVEPRAGRNLLDPPRRLTQGGLIIEEISTGRELGLSLGWRAGG